MVIRHSGSSSTVTSGDLHSDELLIRQELGNWLVETLAADQPEPLSYLTQAYPRAGPIWQLVAELVETDPDSASPSSLDHVRLKLRNGEYGLQLQQMLSPADRKSLAANYTDMLASRILADFVPSSQPQRIIDPFCGSGRLLVSWLQAHQGSFPEVHINDLLPSAVLVAFCNVVSCFIDAQEPISKIVVTTGNAFDHPPQLEFDLILMNPPYTRVHYLDAATRNSLTTLRQQFPQLVSGQPGLHVYAMLLSELLLSDRGMVAAVLPRSLLASDYGTELRSILADRIITMIFPANTISFSDGSDFAEFMLFYIANHSTEPVEVQQLQLQPPHWTSISEQQIDRLQFSQMRLWTQFLLPNSFRRLASQLMPSLTDPSQLDFKRGIEMYGPHFFFLPNKRWDIVGSNHQKLKIRFKADKSSKLSRPIELELDSQYVTRCLRRPGIYSQASSPQVEEYCLILDDTALGDPQVEQYLELTSDLASSAQQKFGESWHQHTQAQIDTKKPFSQLFLVDKLAVDSTGCLTHFTSEPLIATKNFYLLVNEDAETAKLLAAWTNSVFYLVLYLLNRRTIGGSYGRLQISDLKRTWMFVAVEKLGQQTRQEVLAAFDQLNHLELPPIPQQFQLKEQQALDLAFAKYLGLEQQLAELYRAVEQYIKGL